MHDEPTGVHTALQFPERKRCPSCGQTRPLADFSTTAAGPSRSCGDRRRTAARLASRRRTAAMRLLIALHPEEWAGLLALVGGRRQAASHAAVGGGTDG
jgi:hypothetical protein